jgi:hypothetical protein
VQIPADHDIGDTGIRLLPNHLNCGPIPLSTTYSPIESKLDARLVRVQRQSHWVLGLPIPSSRVRRGIEIQVVVYGVGDPACAGV